MLNQEIKQEYLDCSSANKNKKVYLDRFCKAEDIYGIDICEFSRDQIIEEVKSICTYELGSCDALLSSIKSYAKWCLQNGYFTDAKMALFSVSSSDIDPTEAIKTYIFASVENLMQEMSKITQIEDGNPGVIACVLAWLGSPRPTEIKDADVNLDSRIISVNGRVISQGFSDTVADFLSDYRKLMWSTRDNATTSYKVIKDCSVDTFVKRFCSINSSKIGKPVDARVVQTALNQMNNKYSEIYGVPRFTISNVLKSGYMRRVYELELSGIDVMDKKNEDIVMSVCETSNYRSIIWMYKHYKVAFNL